MNRMTRRGFLASTSAAALAGLAVACSGGGSTTGSSQGAGGGGAGLRWWDHFGALQKFHAEWAAKESAEVGATIEYTYNDASKATQALQLANQSKQLPDIYSNMLGLPLSALVKDKWVSELKLSDEAVAALPEGSFTEGITNVGKAVYGLPMFSIRQYSAATWFNTDLFAKAGLDAKAPPTSYDDFREACKKIKKNGAAGMILALGDPGRMRDQIDHLAQASGFAGRDGMLFKTGEYAFDDEAYVNAIEFWKELNDDGHLVAGTASFTVANARTRFATGVAGFFPDGPWCAGGVKAILPAFVPKLGVGPILTAEAGAPVTVYEGSPAAQFFVSGTSKNVEAATQVLESFTSPEYQKGLAEGMDQPPLNLDVVETADVIEPYKAVVGFFKETVYKCPDALIRNPEISVVQAQSKPINPHLGNIVQGYLGGDVTDLRGSLKKLNDTYAKDREQAIKAATKSGAKVSDEDYAFSDWKPGMDYSAS